MLSEGQDERPIWVPPTWVPQAWAPQTGAPLTQVPPTWVARQAALSELRDGARCRRLLQSRHPRRRGTAWLVEHVLTAGPLELRDR